MRHIDDLAANAGEAASDGVGARDRVQYLAGTYLVPEISHLLGNDLV